jgi:SAM-dependent methyltransferase
MVRRDHYGDGAWYDAEYVHVGADIPGYRAWAARRGGPILELACGTGRLTFPMAETGAEVVGVDASAPMLARAEEKRRRWSTTSSGEVSFELGDMRDVRLGRAFAGVVIGLNSLMHMTEDDDLASALETARLHLEPGGLLAVDVFSVPPAALGRDPEDRFDPQEMIDPRDGQRYVVTESTRYDAARQLHQLSFFYLPVDSGGRPCGPELRSELELRVVFPRELDLWLRVTGFEIVGDWDDLEATTPFSGRGGRRFVEARPVARRMR